MSNKMSGKSLVSSILANVQKDDKTPQGDTPNETVSNVPQESDNKEVDTSNNDTKSVPAEQPQDLNKPDAVKPSSDKQKPSSRKKVGEQVSQLSGLNLEELKEILKEERKNFNISSSIVYVDSDIAEVLERFKKKAKINASTLVSWVLKNYLMENKHLLEELKEQKGNKFLD